MLIADTPMLIADTPTAEVVRSATSLLQDRGDAMLILTSIFALAGLWIWKVVIPERASRREQDALREAARVETEKLHSETLAKQAETIAALGQVTAMIHDTTNNTHNNTAVLLRLSELHIDCAEKITHHVGCHSVRDSLSEMRGIVKLTVSSGRSRDRSQ